MSDYSHQLSEQELLQWQAGLAEANRNNVLCHCKRCDREWVESRKGVMCECGSKDVESIACWQFPDG